MKTYAGKTALVTGASSGIGKALAESLAARGANLILVARSADRLEHLATALRGKGVEATVIAADLAQPGAAARLHAEVERHGLCVDLLVNNAGFGKWGRFEGESLATYGEMIALNIQAVLELCHLFMPGMAARGDCGVLNISSAVAFVPLPWTAVYAASKAFVLSFSEALFYEFKGKGVQVTVLCPGNTESNFAAVAYAAARPRAPDDSAAMVADVGLDALLAGRASIISGNNKKVAWLPRILSRERVVALVGETWRKRLLVLGVPV